MEKDNYALFKYSVIASFINKTSEFVTIRSFCKQVSKDKYFFEGKYLRINEETIRKWIRQYQKGGYDGLKRKTRKDMNVPRKLDDDILIRIDTLKTEYPKMRTTALYNKLIDEGYFNSNDISVRTFQRFIRSKNYLDLNSDHQRKTFTLAHPNDSWQADTTQGPYITIKNQKYKTYIIVFIDDHSRLIVGAKAFFNDNALNMQQLFKKAILFHGVPRQLQVDNGKPYSNKQLSIICAKLGVKLIHAKPFDAQSKGKVERFNSTLKQTWMNNFNWNDINDLDDLNNRLDKYIISYNNTIHKSLNNTPNNVYFADIKQTSIKRIEKDTLDKYFYHTVSRKVGLTGLVQIENRVYEIDYSYIRKTIEFTYDPDDLSKIYVGDKAYGLLDSIGNSTKRRKKNVDYSKIVNKENEELKDYEGE